MKCPECDNDKIVIVHTDPIPCHDCKKIVKIDYCVCPACDFTFRTNNGEHMDGSLLDYEVMDEVFEELIDAMDAEMGDVKMSNLIHNCVKCGDPASYQVDEFHYRCPVCGFEWEIIRHE